MKQALIQYRTAMGSYGSLSRDVESTTGVDEVVPWALQQLPVGSVIVSYRFEPRFAYPEETILRKLEVSSYV